MTPVMSYDELLARNVALIDRVCHKQAAEGSRFIDDLDLDSIDLVGLVAEMEAEFGVFVPEEELRKFVTVGDVTRCVESLLEPERVA